jgi:hypothetical protein
MLLSSGKVRLLAIVLFVRQFWTVLVVPAVVRNPSFWFVEQNAAPRANLMIAPASTYDDEWKTTSFPSFKDTGVIFFYHIPRTGGTTIRNTLLQGLVQKNLTYFRAFRPKDTRTVNDRIQAIVNGSRVELLLVELHGHVPGLPVWREYLHQWRTTAARTSSKNNHTIIPLFAFTVLREPAAFHVSYLHHFHSPRCTWAWCEPDLVQDDTTSDDPNQILARARPNHQCHLLGHGQEGNKKLKKKKNQPNHSWTDATDSWETVQRDLHAHWDWVGTTEGLQRLTLSVLSRILVQNCTVWRNMESFNARRRDNATTSVSLLLDSTTFGVSSALRDLSPQDVELYNWARSREQKKFKALQC